MHLNRCQNHELGWTEGGLRVTSSLLTSCRGFSCFRDGVDRFRFFIQKRRRCLFCVGRAYIMLVDPAIRVQTSRPSERAVDKVPERGRYQELAIPPAHLAQHGWLRQSEKSETSEVADGMLHLKSENISDWMA